jgi:hypothetical protein
VRLAVLKATTWYAEDALTELEPGDVRLVTMALRFVEEGTYGGRPTNLFEAIGTEMADVQPVSQPRRS